MGGKQVWLQSLQPGRFANRSHALPIHTNNPQTTYALPTESCQTGFPRYESSKAFWHAASWSHLLSLFGMSTVIPTAHEQFPRLTEASHRQIMGGSNERASTFPRQIIYSRSSTKTLNIPDRLVTSISLHDAASQARRDDPAPLADKTNVYQINSSREIIEQTIKGFVDYKFIVLLIVCTWRR